MRSETLEWSWAFNSFKPLEQSSSGPKQHSLFRGPTTHIPKLMVGDGGFEPPTSSMSTTRSNQLS